eukprot:GEMP01021808.1.p1 GENE.GEMP01021808.1~~GEMP01021808.1.p1  ORF type:complete len:523 (-),score=108.43 GEMP01021808.1:904-2472(-)
MVLLSVALTSKSKTLVARQFVDMTRLRVEGLLNTFPKLLGASTDHTFIETENVRYVYQPLEQLYLVLITNKTSNIMEDLETLTLLANVVREICLLPLTDELVTSKAFDLIFAFDEVVSFGHRESVTMSQITAYTQMESHEEKLFQMIQQSKMDEAKEVARKKVGELRKMHGKSKGKENDSNAGISNSDQKPDVTPEQSVQQVIPMLPESSPWDAAEVPVATHHAKFAKGGMSLGIKKKTVFGMLSNNDGEEQRMGHNDIENLANQMPEETAIAPVAVNPLQEQVSVTIEEHVRANLQAEGGLNGDIEVQGKFDVLVHDQKADRVCFQLGDLTEGTFKYKSNPLLNKQSQAKGLLEPRDPTKSSYALNVPKSLIKWLMKSTDEDHLPITLSCWPSPTPDGASIVLEYELTNSNITLTDVHIRFPCPARACADVDAPDIGQADYDEGAQQVHWYIPRIDANENSGMLEFSAKCDADSLMPFTFEAESKQLMAPVGIKRCFHQTRNDDIHYALNAIVHYGFTIGN